MLVRLAEPCDLSRWNRFVNSRAEAVNYQRWEWGDVIQKAFGWRSFYAMAESGGQIVGVLPLTWVKSRLFGNLLCSVGFFSTGGILASNDDATQALLQRAIKLAKELGADSLELRQLHRIPLDLPVNTSKVTLISEVHSDPEVMLAAFETKMRTKVRRVMKSEMQAEFGGLEFLEDFYGVFARRMRELGTPVYSKAFFREILRLFPKEAYICRVRHEGETIASSFLTGFRETLEANWSSSLNEFSGMRPNMFLYWNVLQYAGRRGYTRFDFGRSTVGSGTHSFKLQWNTSEFPLHWYYWTPDGKQELGLNQDNPKFTLAVATWKKLPLFLTTVLGPKISRCLP